MADAHLRFDKPIHEKILSGAPELEHDVDFRLHLQFDGGNLAGMLGSTAMANPVGFVRMVQQMHADHLADPTSVPDAELEIKHGQLMGIDFANSEGKIVHFGVSVAAEQNAQIEQALRDR